MTAIATVMSPVTRIPLRAWVAAIVLASLFGAEHAATAIPATTKRVQAVVAVDPIVPRVAPVALVPAPQGLIRYRGVVGPSLYRAARAAGAAPDVVQSYLQAIAPHLDLSSDLAPDAKFDFVVAYQGAPDGRAGAARLLYAGLAQPNGGSVLELLRGPRDNALRAAPGRAAPIREMSPGATHGLNLAAVAGRVSSGFGPRYHPILGVMRMHAGIDFAAAFGSPIRALRDGRVDYAGWHGGHGNFVRIDHGEGFGSGYAHMSRIAVSPGEPVRAGQIIGFVGSTGLSTGPHLHLEAYHNGRVVNPLGELTTQSVAWQHAEVSNSAALVAFRRELAGIKASARLTSTPHAGD